MKRRLQMTWLSLMAILLAGLLAGIGSVQASPAAVTWIDSLYDPVVGASYNPIGATYSIQNGGGLVTLNGGYRAYESIQGDASSSALGTPVETTHTDNFGDDSGARGSISVSGMAGGELLDNGISNTVSASITASDLGGEYIETGSQMVRSFIKRPFSVEAGAEVTIDASIDDIIANWAVDNYSWGLGIADYPYSNYKITASVQILPGTLLSGGTVVIPDSIELYYHLDDDGELQSKLSDTVSFIAADDYYMLMTSLTIDTRVGNFLSTEGPKGDLPDVGTINTMTMNTTVNATSAVPVPGSMLLLFSGLVGLAALRRS